MVARRRRADVPRERGATLVEFVAVFPVLVLLIIGLFTGANLANQQIQVSHAARDGARYGASLDIRAGWAAVVKAKVTAQALGSFTSADVCVALVRGPGSDPTLVTAGAPLDPTTRVVVRVAATGSLSWVFGTSTSTWKSTSTALWEPFEQYAASGGIPIAAGLTPADFSSPSTADPADPTCKGSSGTNQYAYLPSSASTTTTVPVTTPMTTAATVPVPPTLVSAGSTQSGVGANLNCNLNGLHQGTGPVSTCGSIDIVSSLLVNGAPPVNQVSLSVGDVITVSVTVPPQGGNNGMYQETSDGIHNHRYDERALQPVTLPTETGTYLSAPSTVTMSRTDNGDRGNGPAINCLLQNGQDPAASDGATAVAVGPTSGVGNTKMWAQVSGTSLTTVWDALSDDRCDNVLSNNGVYAGFTISFTQTVTGVPVGVSLAPQWVVQPFRMARDDNSHTIQWGAPQTMGWVAS